MTDIGTPPGTLPDDLINSLTTAVQRAGELLSVMPLDELEAHFYAKLTARRCANVLFGDSTDDLINVVDMIAAAQSLARAATQVGRDAEQHERRRAAAEHARTIVHAAVEQAANL